MKKLLKINYTEKTSFKSFIALKMYIHESFFWLARKTCNYQSIIFFIGALDGFDQDFLLSYRELWKIFNREKMFRFTFTFVLHLRRMRSPQSMNTGDITDA